MANERELLIVVKARDEANRVIKDTSKSIQTIGKDAKKTESEFEKFAKTMLGLGAIFQTVKRVASQIPEVQAFSEAYWFAIADSIRAAGGALNEFVGGALGRFADWFQSDAQSRKVENLVEQLDKMREIVQGSGRYGLAGDTIIDQLEAEIRRATSVEALIGRGVEKGLAERLAAEVEKIRSIAPPLSTGLRATVDGVDKVDIFGLLKLDPDASTKSRVDAAVLKLRDQFAQSIRTQNLANEIADVYEINDADAKKIAETIAGAVAEAIPETIGQTVGESFAEGFKNAAADIKAEFQNLTKIGEQFANDLFNVLSDNFFRAAKQEFKDFGDFAKSILRGILDSLLAILSRLAASQLLSLGSNLLGGNGITLPGSGGQSAATTFPGLEGGGSSSSSSSAPITIHINAIDAQSFADAVQRNPGAIAAAATAGISRNNALRANLRGAIS